MRIREILINQTTGTNQSTSRDQPANQPGPTCQPTGAQRDRPASVCVCVGRRDPSTPEETKQQQSKPDRGTPDQSIPQKPKPDPRALTGATLIVTITLKPCPSIIEQPFD